MRRASFDDMACSVAQSLEIVGEWWTPLIVRDALLGVTRFGDFQERLGIARNILATRLDALVEHGVMARVPYQDNPPRFDYVLTDKGRDLWLVIAALRQWGDRWESPDGSPVELVHRSCDHVTRIIPTCAECGEELRPRDLRVRRGPGATATTPAVPG
ncbi:MAG: helix-turn-helix domain-containing protein [Acidimicrobiales bacterium]|nr:helix-turn-helix transcriptional regulator [Acidimicrobiales bacterium]